MALSFRENVRLARLREESRIERYVRAGAGFAAPQNTIQSKGSGFAPPISGSENVQPATIVLGCEFANGALFPNANGATTALLNTRRFRLVLSTTGSLRLLQTITDPFPITVELINVQIDSPAIPGGGVGPSGFHYIAVFIEPHTGGVNSRFGLWLNGDQIGRVVDVISAADWSSTNPADTWTYLGGTGIGSFSPCEIYPGFVPPTFA